MIIPVRLLSLHHPNNPFGRRAGRPRCALSTSTSRRGLQAEEKQNLDLYRRSEPYSLPAAAARMCGSGPIASQCGKKLNILPITTHLRLEPSQTFAFRYCSEEWPGHLVSLLCLHLQLVVDPLQLHQLFMVAFLHHPAVSVHQNHIAALNCGQPMSNGEGSAPFSSSL